ncbi:MAG TPA: hypothetical protein VFA65_24570 [Bryobacteraceae bacterium]|nr:hypothetical protein [Bryobacteraceae bacterium]
MTSDAWKVVQTPDRMKHVIPAADLRVHVYSSECWCRPFDPFADQTTLVHQSMDKREEFELGRRAP